MNKKPRNIKNIIIKGEYKVENTQNYQALQTNHSIDMTYETHVFNAGYNRLKNHDSMRRELPTCTYPNIGPSEQSSVSELVSPHQLRLQFIKDEEPDQPKKHTHTVKKVKALNKTHDLGVTLDEVGNLLFTIL